MTSTEKFWDYLKPILEDAEPQTVMLSDADRMDRLIESSRSEEMYPAVFVMRPAYSGLKADNAALVAMFNVQLFVLCQGRVDDYASQDAAFQQSEEIAELIVQALQHDSLTYKCWFDFGSLKIEPVVYTTVDATYGYEVKLKCGIIANEQFC